ncbi:MAG: polyprenyl synthetase family protein [candidate division WOR-3 bacterium]|nr:polyprenyl synthetase family protein [candidate division WOR-3 bacterium]MDW8150459.1 polyprenyl synthetase family protein [candidate division WOR-3 bacterium]
MLKEIWSNFNKSLEEYLYQNLPKVWEEPSILHEAMWYSLEGGKRVRPFLAYLGYRLNIEHVNEKLYDLASAIELIHTFSIVHDDLPALDNDDYRRNKLSVHKKFSESIAILTGDALFAYAFKFLNRLDKKISEIIIDALLSNGMIGGQVIDIQKNVKTFNDLQKLHYYKTGKLIEASLTAGYMLSGGEKIRTISEIGKNIGLLFQLVDDVADKNKNEETNVLKFLGYEATIEKINELKNSLQILIIENFEEGRILYDFVDFLVIGYE